MASVIKKLVNDNKISFPYDFVGEPSYEVIMGSEAYGVSNEGSDIDVYSVCVPTKELVFPHLTGHIYGFGPKPKTFENYQKHHIMMDNQEYDVVVYGIVKYIELCSMANPNMIDSMFVPERCILQSDEIGDHIRVNRHKFLSKEVFYTYGGFARAEIKRLNRKETWNPKPAYHVIRLLGEAIYILENHDLELEINTNVLKKIRNDEYGVVEVEKLFEEYENILAKTHASTTLQEKPNYFDIHNTLKECLEIKFGSLSKLC